MAGLYTISWQMDQLSFVSSSINLKSMVQGVSEWVSRSGQIDMQF